MASAIAADRSAQRLAKSGSVRSRRETSSWLPSQPVVSGETGPGEQVAHHLDQAVAGDRLHHGGRVVLGDGEEERVLVAEVVEDRAPGEAGLLLQPADGGALVAVPGEAGPRAGEDLLPARVELVLAYPGHASIVTGQPGVMQSVRTACATWVHIFSSCFGLLKSDPVP